MIIFNISQKRVNKILLFFFLGMSIVILFSCGILFFIDRRFNQLILPYIDIEVERLTNNIIQKEIHNFMIQNQYDDLFFQKNEQGNILYDSYQLAVIQTKITANLQDLLWVNLKWKLLMKWILVKLRFLDLKKRLFYN